MRAEVCGKCPFSNDEMCMRLGKKLAKVRGCSMSPGGRMFFRARSGAEAFRMNLKTKKEEKA